jgi:catechol 2,3-dioxygenase-like lactoylglutathione lyase family enzyme
MGAELNHTIIWCRDKEKSSQFLARMLSRPAPVDFHHFKVVPLDNDVSIDFMEKDGAVSPQHYAFLLDEPRFDAAYAIIRDEGINHWADPARSRPNQINRNDGGRGVYFEDPDGHFMEIITRPYGSD